MTTDFLHRFVRSLERSEADACLASQYMNASKWSVQRKALFAMLRTMEQYDVDALRAHFSADTAYQKVLVHEKYRMQRALVRAVKDWQREESEGTDPNECLSEARFLLSRGFATEAAYLTTEGIAVAVQLNDLLAEADLREHLRTVYKLLPRGENEAAITENEYRLETLMRQLVNLNRMNVLCDRMSDYVRKYRLADEAHLRTAVEAIMADPDLQHINNALSLPAQIRFMSAWAMYTEFVGQLERSLSYREQCCGLWEQNPARMARLPHLYREALSNQIGMLMRLDRKNEVPALLLKMEQVPINDRRGEMMAFCDVELQYQLFLMNMWRPKEVVERRERVEKGLRGFGRLVPESKTITLLYNLGISYLMLGENQEAKGFFSRIRELGKVTARLDLQALAQIFRLLLILESETSDRFHYYLRSTDRSFRKGMPHYRLEDTVHKWIKRHQHEFHTLAKRDCAMRLYKALEPFEKEKMAGAEELRFWALSRGTGRPIQEVIGPDRCIREGPCGCPITPSPRSHARA